MKYLIKSHPILSYLILTFSISWFCWFLPMFIEIERDILFGINFVGILGPPISAFVLLHSLSGAKIKIDSKKLFLIFFLVCVAIVFLRLYSVETGGRDWNGFYPKLSDIRLIGYVLPLLCCFFLGLNASNALNKNLKENYIKTLLFEKRKIKWYLFALLFYPFLFASSFLIGQLFDFPTSDSLIEFDTTFIIGFLMLLFIAGGTEEFGWRGFLQKEIQKKYNPLLTILFVGFLWSLWHLPMYFNGVYSTDGFSAYFSSIPHTLQITVLFTWLYNKSSYSILAVMILHSMNNNVGYIFGVSYIPAMILAVVIVVILIIDNKMWKRKNYAEEIYSNNL